MMRSVVKFIGSTVHVKLSIERISFKIFHVKNSVYRKLYHNMGPHTTIHKVSKT